MASIVRTKRDLFTKFGQCATEVPMSMFGWVLNKSKILPKMVILPHPRYGDFYSILPVF